MKIIYNLKLVFLLLFLSNDLFAQNSTINGYVKDNITGETLIGVNIYLQETYNGTITNEYGFFSLTEKKGEYNLNLSYIGYKDTIIKIDLSKNITLDINLSKSTVELEEVKIDAERLGDKVKNVQMSVNKLNIKEISEIPSFAGEVDIIKSILTLPGISSTSEASSGFNVRGGDSDQNLILMDEAPIYNYSHLLGLFSIFNPDAVKDVKVYKGGIPARYSGRLSSVVDIRLRDGNYKRIEAKGGIGTIFSRLTVEGPILKDKISFIVSGRRSYIDLLAKPFLKESNTKLYFYDLSAKLNYKINSKNQIFFSAYLGSDVAKFNVANLNWGNSLATLRWNSIYSDKIFTNLSFIYSRYLYNLKFSGNDKSSFQWKSRIENFKLKYGLSYYLNSKNIIRGGFSSLIYFNNPAEAFSISKDGTKNEVNVDNTKSSESYIYLENEQNVTNKLKLSYGLTYSFYFYLGGNKVFTFDDKVNFDNNGNAIPKKATGVFETSEWDIVKKYSNLEPRLAINYSINDDNSIKLSYNRLSQYINLLSNTASPSPLATWGFASYNIKPQLLNQYAIGYFKNFKKLDIEASLEFYYKTIENSIEFVSNADLLFNKRIEGDILQGKGRAYGMEFFVEKKLGRFRSRLSYSLSRSEKKVDGVSNNKWYKNSFDKLHDLSVFGNYTLNKRISFSANFIFSSGLPISIPTNQIKLGNYITTTNVSNERNIDRIPSNHRLDISMKLKNREKPNRRYKWDLTFGIYNVYANKNAFSVFFRPNENNPNKVEAVRLSIVPTLIPSITYNFKF